jgi:predicted ATPase/transcriptional regulator with XRE-family HTH domain
VSELAVVLRRLRERMRLTQEELAERSGVSARTISDVERGIRTRVYGETAARLATALTLVGPERDDFVEIARGRAHPESAPAGAVPHPLTPMIGRAAELERVAQALEPRAGGRLVTITGLGGSGKSRLAIAAAQQLSAAYDGRVWFVPLATVQNPDWMMDAVAGVLGTMPSKIAATVGRRPTLLVLDAFEHVLPAVDRLAQLLRETAGVRALVTSRVPLRIAGEREVALGPLPAEQAAQLFLARAHDVTPEPEDDAATVAQICALTSGLPLAIELAAAHLRYLPIALLRERLGAGLPDVDRAVQDAVAWSVASLTDEERRVLAGAAMFVAGCTLDALQAVCPAADVVAALHALSDKSLVVLDRAAGTPRWRMLDVVREAVSRAAPADSRRRAYAAFYVEMLSEVADRVGDEAAWYRTLAGEEPNIRTALMWAEEWREADTLLALATALWLYWQSRGALAEGRRWLAAGLQMQPAATPALRVRAWWGLGWLAYHQGDDAAAAVAGEELAALAEECGDGFARRNALTIAGMVAIGRDRPEDSLALLTDALGLARDLGRPWILATSLLNLALAQLAAGAPGAARPLLGEALQGYEAIGDRRFHARCVGYLGLAALLDGDAERAGALFRQSLTAFRDLEEPAGLAEGLAGLAAVSAAVRQPVAAAVLGGAAERVRETVAARELPLERRVAARYLEPAAEQLGRASWDEAWRRGFELPTGDAIELALAKEVAQAWQGQGGE